MTTTTVKKKVFFLLFCLASIIQGMYSTYFVSILTTIERLYQIQSKTAGFIMSATEIGQILGVLLIAYYGGKGNKPKWMAACMTLIGVSALISTTPHFLLQSSSVENVQPGTTVYASPQHHSIINNKQDLNLSSPLPSSKQQQHLPSQDQLCVLTSIANPFVLNSTSNPKLEPSTTTISPLRQKPIGAILVIFFLCLLAIGFGSTAITTLGIPFIDDIVTKEESPLYLGLTIGLKIFGPALGFLLGSFCIRLDVDFLTKPALTISSESTINNYVDPDAIGVGAWWLGIIIISLPLILLALPMYYLSRFITKSNNDSLSDFEDITYQAAEDHDIGGSRDFQAHVLTVGDLDVTSNRTCYSEVVDSSSREVLQAAAAAAAAANNQLSKYNYGTNLILDRPIIIRENIFNNNNNKKNNNNKSVDCCEKPLTKTIVDDWNTSCIVVDHFGNLEPSNFNNQQQQPNETTTTTRSSSSTTSTTNSSSSSLAHAPPPPPSTSLSSSAKLSTMNLTNSLSRLISNKLLLLRLISGSLHILPIAGFFTFLPKYLIEQFRIAPSSASAISGLAGILFVGLGAFLGGTIIRLLNVNSKFMTRWIATSALLYAIGMLILMNLGCPQNQIVHIESGDFKVTDCLLNCQCDGNIYNPVCANGTTYMSPCLAGCKYQSTAGDRIIYDECGCSPQQQQQQQQPQQPLTSAPPATTSETNHLNLNVATLGHCIQNCDNLKWYIILFSIFTLIHASCEVGSMMFNLRCVKSSDRTLALGLITFTSSLLGTIPCSVIYGTVIDLTCIYWDSFPATNQDELASKGACRAYKNDSFRLYLHGFTAIVMFLAFIVDCIIVGRADQVDFYDKNDSKSEVKVALKKSTETI